MSGCNLIHFVSTHFSCNFLVHFGLSVIGGVQVRTNEKTCKTMVFQ